jgi:hypothetical protein
MGYYDAADVPVYDHLAEEFAVCDRWFSSVPGATLPNRLYGLCGAAAGSRDDRPGMCLPCTTSRPSSASDHRLAVDGAAHRIEHRVRSHLDHQDDPAAGSVRMR